MANATVKEVAPLKKEPVIITVLGQQVQEGSKEHRALTMEFNPDIKYMFELATPNPERDKPVINARTNRVEPHKKYKPTQNIVLSSQIVWKGARINIRYYDGCNTIFVQDQPKEKDVIDDLIAKTSKDKYWFLEGKFGAYGDEKMLLLYLNMCSWNAESEFRTRTASAIFVPVNKAKAAQATQTKLDNIKLAMQYSEEASETKMLIHANYLGIPTMDFDSGNELTPEEIKIAYREEAVRNPAYFIETYGNTSIEIKYYIDKALQDGIISNRYNPNKATWGSNNSEICDISGLKSLDAIGDKIFEFSQMEAGQEFVIQLKALFNG